MNSTLSEMNDSDCNFKLYRDSTRKGKKIFETVSANAIVSQVPYESIWKIRVRRVEEYLRPQPRIEYSRFASNVAMDDDWINYSYY